MVEQQKEYIAQANALPLFVWMWRSHRRTALASFLCVVILFTVYLLLNQSSPKQHLWIIGGLVFFYAVLLPLLRHQSRIMAHSITEPLRSMDTLLQHIGDNDSKQQEPIFPVIELQQTVNRLVKVERQLSISNRRLLAAQQEAEQARDEALTSLRLKTEFLASVSHEIRTPMNGILGMVDLLLDTRLTGKQREFAMTVQDSAQSLLRIINDILDLSKIEAGKVELAKVNFVVPDLVEDATDILAPRAHEKHLKLMSYVDPSIPAPLAGDEGRLRQILLNLLSNAVKFSERGEVILRVVLEKKTSRYAILNFMVLDTGIGIPAAAHSRLFQPFTQVDGSAARRYGGTGLGLSICKRLVEMLGGEIGMESREGIGSKFWFKVPLSLESHSAPREWNPSWERLRVLVVESGQRSRAVLRDYLGFWKVNVIAVADVKSALAVLKSSHNERIDILLLGLTLGQDNDRSWEVLARHEKWKIIPRVLLADTDRRNLQWQAKAHGFVACLTKPVRQMRLFDCLQDIVSQAAHIEKANLSLGESVMGGIEVMPVLAHRPRILLAEDNEINRKVAMGQLRKLGYAVDVAENGHTAVVKALSRQYAVILMDIQMPVMDGIEATRIIRATETDQGRRVIIVAVTANAMEGDRERFLAEGMDDYQSKPYRMAQLQLLLQRWLN